MFLPTVLTWVAFQKVSAPCVASEARKVLMVRNINMEHQYRMPLDLPLVHLYPISVVELGGMGTGPALVRDRLTDHGRKVLV